MDPFANDPFSADNPADAATPAPAAAPAAPPVHSGPAKFSAKITLKFAGGYDAEWLTPYVSGDTAEEVARNIIDLLQAFKDHGIIELVSNAAQYSREQYKGRPSGGGGSQPRQQPQQNNNTPPPGVEPRSCAHGPMTFRSGKNRFGKDYQAFFCPAPRDAHDKCSPVFL